MHKSVAFKDTFVYNKDGFLGGYKMTGVNLNDKSLLDIAEDILRESNGPVSIYDLIEKTAIIKGLDPQNAEDMTNIYMDITLSGRFVYIGEDKLALKEGNLEYWDKDGFEFYTQEGEDGFDDVEEDFSDFSFDDIEDLDEELEDEELEDEELEDLDEEEIEEKAYVDVGLDLDSTDEDDDVDNIDLDLDDDDYDEDDYNAIMDDYEDMYDE